MGDFEEISFPILSFKEKDSHIYGIKQRDFGLVTKGQGKFYDGLSIIDSNCRSFQIMSWSVVGRAGLFKCIQHFQVMEQLAFELKPIEQLTLNDIRAKVLAHIQRHPKTFAPLYDGTSWQQRLESFNTIKEVIHLFI